MKVTDGYACGYHHERVIDWAIREARRKSEACVDFTRQQRVVTLDVELDPYGDHINEAEAVQYIEAAKQALGEALDRAGGMAEFLSEVYGLMPMKQKEET